jgi:hypothetical protein
MNFRQEVLSDSVCGPILKKIESERDEVISCYKIQLALLEFREKEVKEKFYLSKVAQPPEAPSSILGENNPCDATLIHPPLPLSSMLESEFDSEEICTLSSLGHDAYPSSTREPPVLLADSHFSKAVFEHFDESEAMT